MQRTRSLRLPLAILLGVAIAGPVAMAETGSSRVGRPETIVFASDREKSNPGEIYSLALDRLPRAISHSLAADYGMAVSPSGDQIAFWSDRTGSDQAYLARSDGSHQRRVRALGATLAPANARDGGPLVFSSDGTRLFVSRSPGSFVVETRAATARALGVCDEGLIQPSPDGRLIACGGRGSTIVTDATGEVRETFPGEHPIWSSHGLLTNRPDPAFLSPRPSAPVFDSSGHRLGRVVGQPLGWSPDGRLLVFRQDRELRVAGPQFRSSRLLLRDSGASAVSFTADGRWVSTVDSSGHPLLVPLTSGRTRAGLDSGLGVWSRAGRLAYVDYRATVRAHPGFTLPVLITDTHGRNPRVVGRFPYDPRSGWVLNWLADGRRVLVATSNDCFGKGLFAVPADGGATHALTNDPRDLETPTASADGSSIAYGVQPFSCSGQPTRLETVSADGTSPRLVADDPGTRDESYNGDPSFSPDGKRVAFDHVTPDGLSVEVATLGESRRAVVLPPTRIWHGAPLWLPDGSRIAYLTAHSIEAVSLRGGPPSVLAPNPTTYGGSCRAGGLAVSPDGTQLAVADWLGIHLIDLARPAASHLAIHAPCAEFPAFSPDGTRIAFDASPPNALGGQTAIMTANVDGTNLRTLSTVPFRESIHPTWQPAR